VIAAPANANPDRRQDLLQETHLALWRSFEHFAQRRSLRTGVYRVAHNVAASHVVGIFDCASNSMTSDSAAVRSRSQNGAVRSHTSALRISLHGNLRKAHGLEKCVSLAASWKPILPDSGKCCVLVEQGVEPSIPPRHAHCRSVACRTQEAFARAGASSS
jgi:hypothetical protein